MRSLPISESKKPRGAYLLIGGGPPGSPEALQLLSPTKNQGGLDLLIAGGPSPPGRPRPSSYSLLQKTERDMRKACMCVFLAFVSKTAAPLYRCDSRALISEVFFLKIARCDCNLGKHINVFSLPSSAKQLLPSTRAIRVPLSSTARNKQAEPH